jgi:transposase
LEPGARVSEIGRRWQICPQQVFGWRRQAQLDMSGSTTEPTACLLPLFVPLVAEAASPAKVVVATAPSAAIEIKLAGAAVRVVSGVDGDLLTAVLRAVRCSSCAK